MITSEFGSLIDVVFYSFFNEKSLLTKKTMRLVTIYIKYKQELVVIMRIYQLRMNRKCLLRKILVIINLLENGL